MQKKKWLNSKFKQYGVLNNDLSTLKIRMDIVPVSLQLLKQQKKLVGEPLDLQLKVMLFLDSGHGQEKVIKPAGVSLKKSHKVMKFKVLKASVRAYQRNLNTHGSYKNLDLKEQI